jgi:hypothetical protein
VFLHKWFVPPGRVPDVGALFFVLHPDLMRLLNVWRVFVFPKPGPYFCGSFDPSPPDFFSHSVIEFSRIVGAKASKGFGFTNSIPTN